MLSCNCASPCNKGLKLPILNPLPVQLIDQLVSIISKPHLEAVELSAGSNILVEWKCDKPSHPSWQASVKSRTAGTGCPYCAGQYAIKGETDFSTTHPHLLKEWDWHQNESIPLDPYKISIGSSNKQAWWKCDKPSHPSWQASVHTRTRSGCPYCSGRLSIKGETDFPTTHPNLVKEWDIERNQQEYNLVPSQVKAGSTSVKHYWKCNQGHSWKIEIANRIKDNTGCPYCAGRLAIKGETDFSTTHPDLLKEWDSERNLQEYGLIPVQVKASSSNRLHYWLCPEHNHSYKSTIANRTAKANTGCPYCQNKKVLQGFNDLATTHAALLKEWNWEKNNNANLYPNQITHGADLLVGWKCNQGHEWDAVVYSRTSKNPNGCIQCSEPNTSKTEKQLQEFIKEQLPTNEIVLFNDRTILGNLELDVYVPSKKIAVEFNGLYWHTEEKGKDKNYHYAKYIRCREQGIQLIQIWEDDWNKKQDLVRRILLNKIGISQEQRINARSLKVKIISYDESEAFLGANHIQGSVRATIYLALVDEQDNIKALILLLKNPTGYEITRYCTSGLVRGGFQKLLAYVERNYMDEGKSLITFSDNTISDGNLYLISGFSSVRDIKPDYSYVANSKRIHKFNYRVERFKTDQKLKYEDGSTERELAKINGLERIWDAGKIKWKKNF